MLRLGDRVFAVRPHQDLGRIARLLRVRILVAGDLDVRLAIGAVPAERHEPAAAFPCVDAIGSFAKCGRPCTPERCDQRGLAAAGRKPHELHCLAAAARRREVLLPLTARPANDDDALTVG